MDQNNLPHPGPIALFGSGETAPGGQKIFDFIFRLSPMSPQVSIIETPAGFELNAGQVAGNVGDFIQHRLQNYKPRIQLIPARKKGTQFSPDDPEIAHPILKSDLIFMGPGSPSYAVRQLENSLTWEYILARHRLGAALAFSSATTVAVSSAALPVYEIYKVGEDLHWKDGLDFFSHYGLPLVFIPHWNNKDGGDGLDTSRCYMGESRFQELKNRLPKDQIVIGIDENTGLVIDFQSACFHVVGQSNVTILQEGSEQIIPAGSGIELIELGDFNLCDPVAGISQTSWDQALSIQSDLDTNPRIPAQVIVLAEKREKARQSKDWETADQLRQAVEVLGWVIQDKPDGFLIEIKTDQ
jgi:hypothetical protein